MPVPKKFTSDQMKYAIPVAAAPKQFSAAQMSASVPVDMSQDMLTNPQGQGTYKMVSSDGSVLHVPFSHVLDAGKYGFAITPTDFTRFKKDYTASLGPRAEIDEFLSPSDESTWAGRGLNVLKGTASGLAAPFIHPEDSAASMGQTYVGANLAPEGMYPGTSSLGAGPTGRAAEQANRAVQAEAQAGIRNQATEAREHPVYTASSIIGPAVATAGLEKYGGDIPGVDMLKRARDRAIERTRINRREKFQGGHAFTEKQVTKFANENAKARAAQKSADEKTELNRGKVDEINRERQVAHQKALDAHHEKVEIIKAAHDEKHAAWEKKRGEMLKAHQDAVKATQEKNAAALSEHIRKTEEISKNNASAEGMLDTRNRLETDIASKSAELHRRIEDAETKAKQADDQAWNRWRGKLLGVKVDMTPVVNEIEAQEANMNPAQVREFNDILRETKPEKGTKTPKEEADELATQAFGTDYDHLNPDQKKVLDEDLQSRGIDITKTGTLKEVPATRLHGWKSQLERSVRSAKDGVVVHAIGQVLDRVRKLEDDVSAAHNASGELQQARELHGPYKEAFVNSPGEPPTVASAYQKKVAPEFTDEQVLEAHAKKLGHYDPEIPKLGAQLQADRAQLKEIPDEPALRKLASEKVPEPPAPEPLPEEPEIPPPPKEPKYPEPPSPPEPEPYEQPEGRPSTPEAEDFTPERKAVLLREIEKYGAVGQWASRMIFGTIFDLGFKMLTGGPIRGVGMFGSTFLIGQGALRLISHVMRRESVLDWLAKPTAEDLKIIETLPPEDAERLKAVISSLAMEDVKRHPDEKNVHIAPAVAAFLGIEGSTKAGSPQTLEELKAEAEKYAPKSDMKAVPSGLPSGVTHYFDPGSNQILPVQ
ncbi:MAG TPA: hypothetical protein VFW94_24295 [Candidatus Acidoferrales bacterium]|nr:hypothetical protein [Candidatus Acidoferrales bacterium]